MSFRFSVSDCLTAGKIVGDIISSLKDAGGSKSEYQELIRELESLDRVLRHLDKLRGSNRSAPGIDSITYAALSCLHPLEEFLNKIKKYESSLGLWASDSPVKQAARKVEWKFGKKDEIHKLQGYLSVHVGTVNILLAEHGLEMLDLVSKRAETHQLDIQESLKEMRGIMEQVKDDAGAQTVVVKTNQSMLNRLFGMISGDIMSSLNLLTGMVSKVCVSTQQIYTILLDIRTTLPSPDIRMTYFQAPLTVEDALGYKFPVPSEYSFDLLESIIRHRFKDGLGSREVQAGNYQLFKSSNSNQDISATTRLLPGMNITMAIIVDQKRSAGEACPRPRCGSRRTAPAPGGGRLCCECQVWFDQSERAFIQNLIEFPVVHNGDVATAYVPESHSPIEPYRNIKFSSGAVLEEISEEILDEDFANLFRLDIAEGRVSCI